MKRSVMPAGIVCAVRNGIREDGVRREYMCCVPRTAVDVPGCPALRF